MFASPTGKWPKSIPVDCKIHSDPVLFIIFIFAFSYIYYMYTQFSFHLVERIAISRKTVQKTVFQKIA